MVVFLKVIKWFKLTKKNLRQVNKLQSVIDFSLLITRLTMGPLLHSLPDVYINYTVFIGNHKSSLYKWFICKELYKS